MSTFISCLRYRSPRQVIAIGVIVVLLSLSIPGPVAAAALKSSKENVNETRSEIGNWLASGWERLNKSVPRERKGVRPAAAPTKQEREARVEAIEVNPATQVQLNSRQPLLFSAIPLDEAGNAIHGLQPQWSSSNKGVLFIRPNGQAVAGKPGEAIAIAQVGNKQATVRVTVVPATTNENFGGKKKVDSTRKEEEAQKRTDNTPQFAQRVDGMRKRSHATRKLPHGMMPFIRNPMRIRFRTTKQLHFTPATTS